MFLIETGEGVANATSYVDVAFADSYFENVGVVAWAGLTTAQKQTALNVGSAYADLRWGELLPSRPMVSAQGLEFPRSTMRDRYGNSLTGVPLAWQKGVCEYAIVATKGSLTPAPSATSPKDIESKTVVIGPITTSTKYSIHSPKGTDLGVFPVADRYCGSFIVVSSGGQGGGGVIR